MGKPADIPTCDSVLDRRFDPDRKHRRIASPNRQVAAAVIACWTGARQTTYTLLNGLF